MIVVVCPHPPLLVEDLDPHRLPELADVRSAALAAVREAVADGPRRVTVVAAQVDGVWDESAGGTLAGFGVEAHAGGEVEALPPDATVGAWLLDTVGWTGPRRYVGVAGPVGDDVLLVLADGTACRTERAPGHFDARAAGFDADVAKALAEGDASALSRIDGVLAEELGMAGHAALTALGDIVSAQTMKGADVMPQLRYDAAPLGVGYWVADWRIGHPAA